MGKRRANEGLSSLTHGMCQLNDSTPAKGTPVTGISTKAPTLDEQESDLCKGAVENRRRAGNLFNHRLYDELPVAKDED